jgi:hypothetical protein
MALFGGQRDASLIRSLNRENNNHSQACFSDVFLIHLKLPAFI